ncbi:hypothetical protein PDESU_01150 [Pontiella desulfatans]|uniref:Uncharacterized protein n=1 Tax=Pontiella desulfatans TaxID=2750659 RepID=A0A6C2TYB0_PONDE|nr:glucoamylase family protein [Pontiella desulfatans]VGO12597.1 hypothetical protein PDESU_01150 [Pontiella desulfatans]
MNRRTFGQLTSSAVLGTGTAFALLRETDEQFLTALLLDTWVCLDDMLDTTTGFPRDTQLPGGHTNTTNIGLYLAALCTAKEVGLIRSAPALQRAEKILTSLEGCKRMHGFMPNFIPVDLKDQKTEGVMAVSDFNKLAVGLIMARRTWPELAERITAFLDAIEWNRLYHPEAGTLSWGYDFNKDAPTGGGRLWLTADTRSAVFMMVASKAAPPEVWARMDRQALDTPYGTICRGYGMGGLFLHAMDGLFLPEIDTEVGESAGNLAWQQIRMAQRRGYPLWGWSNCYMPGSGYTQGGYLSEHVVTPHAVALMLDYYPLHATATLREMVQRDGTVPPKGYEGKRRGLRDAFNMKTGQWDHRYLSLDQGMLFLALANHLHNGIVRKIYASDPLIHHGLQLLKPHIKQRPELLQTWKQRDAIPWKTDPKPSKSISPNIQFPLSNCSTDAPAHIRFQPLETGAVGINYLAKGSTAPTHATFKFPPVNLFVLKQIEIDLEIQEATPEPPGWMRVLLIDRFKQERYAHIELGKQQTTYRINADNLLGIHIDETAVTSLKIQFWRNPWFYNDKRLLADQLNLKLNSIRIINQP